ncbi:MAG: polysaccharide biosynthesis C-terminal domain-containing protein [Spirochaetaceae bacterium]|jgi:putative MATE family efflux protein|nr:polysaccharide biosynthesis C-terminal domain-containing protein [Spirochaetaceae bacterium]
MVFLSRRFGPLRFYRETLNIALPVMLQQLIMSMVSLIDNFMVAGLGDTSMAAVNVANQINFIFIMATTAICSAGGIYLAQFKGAGDDAGMRHAYRFKAIFALGLAAVFFVFYWTIPRSLIAMMTMGNAAQDEIVAIGGGYIRLSAFTLIPMAVSMAIGSSFREIGRPRIPLVFSAAATLVNTAGNWLLIYGNLGAPRLEVAGAAIATIFARLFELGLFLWYAGKNRTPFFVGFRKIFRVDRKLIRTILAKSAMIFLSEASWISSETIMTALYNGRGGAEVVAGMAAGFTIANIFFLLFGGIWTTAAVVVGGSLGAGKLAEARTRAEWLKSGAVVMGIFTAFIGAGLSTVLIPLVFTKLTGSARHISLSLVYVILIYLPLWCLLNAQFAISRAGGDAAMGMYADVSVNSLLFIPGAFILALCTSLDPVVMFALLKTTDAAKYLVARYFYKKERWVRNLAAARLVD